MIIEKIDKNKECVTLTLTADEVGYIQNALFNITDANTDNTANIYTDIRKLDAKFGIVYEIVKCGMVSGYIIDYARNLGLTEEHT